MDNINKPRARKIMAGMFGSEQREEEEEDEEKKPKKKPGYYELISQMISGKKG